MGGLLGRVGEGISDKGGPEQKPEGSKEPGIWMSGKPPVPGLCQGLQRRPMCVTSQNPHAHFARLSVTLPICKMVKQGPKFN